MSRAGKPAGTAHNGVAVLAVLRASTCAGYSRLQPGAAHGWAIRNPASCTQRASLGAQRRLATFGTRNGQRQCIHESWTHNPAPPISLHSPRSTIGNYLPTHQCYRNSNPPLGRSGFAGSGLRTMASHLRRSIARVPGRNAIEHWGSTLWWWSRSATTMPLGPVMR